MADDATSPAASSMRDYELETAKNENLALKKQILELELLLQFYKENEQEKPTTSEIGIQTLETSVVSPKIPVASSAKVDKIGRAPSSSSKASLDWCTIGRTNDDDSEDVILCAESSSENDQQDLRESPKQPISVAEMVRAAAEQVQTAQMLPGYVLHGSGLYYNAETGYFYDPTSQLFFHTKTQKYYFYDAEAKKFKIWGENPTEIQASDPLEFTKTKYKRLARRYGVAGSSATELDSTAFEVVMDLLDCLELSDKKGKRGKRSYFSLLQGGAADEVWKPEQEEPEVSEPVIDLTEEMKREEMLSSSSDSSFSSDDDPDFGRDFGSRICDPEYREMMKKRRKEYKAAVHAPCIRLMEQPEGTLHIVTIMGVTIGRFNCDVNLDDENTSRCHARIRYTEKKRKSGKKSGKSAYFIEDMESRNGTTVNGTKTIVGFPTELKHMDRIQIATKVLVVHIHHGSNTCPGCEQGLVQTTQKTIAGPSGGDEEIMCLSGPGKEKMRKKNLREMKQRYGLEGSSANALASLNTSKYEDRAETRRITVGSDPILPPRVDAPPPAVTEKKITAENKGFRMLSKMGWKEGASLGKTFRGIKEPVSLTNNMGKTGFGSGQWTDPARIPRQTVQMKKKQEIWQKTQERFRKIETPSFTTSQPAPPGTEDVECTQVKKRDAAPKKVETIQYDSDDDDDVIMEKEVIRKTR